MARMEKFFGGMDKINVTASVGENSVNSKDDVMVVQAMLKYALEKRSYFRRFKFPEPTGTFDRETAALIREYQRYLRRKNNAPISVDGVISRAVGEKPFGSSGLWTILYLNSDVLEMRLLSGGEGNEFEVLCRKFPQLFAVLEDVPVGSLGLSLEPSGTGTLNLGLE
jgi:hypothetical protein